MRTRSFAYLLALAIVACTPTSDATTTPAPVTTAAPATTTPTTAGPTTTIDPGRCGPGADLVDDGPVFTQSQVTSDAEQIGAITWDDTDVNCERFVIPFVTAQAAPATTPPTVEAEFLREVGVLRVAVDVEATAVTDQLVQSGLVDRYYVVRQANRSLFIDFLLTGAATARVSVTESPGQVVIELQSGGGPYGANPAIANNVVVIAPTAGVVTVPIEITGYSRNFEANNIGRVTQGATVLAQEVATAADWTETWGEFSLSISPVGSGPADLFIGDQSPQDGSDLGVVIPIELP
jgi:hypothetical protein